MLSIAFVGLTQLGFYSYLFISTENAARSAASRNSFSAETAVDQEAACSMVTEELRGLIPAGSPGTCQDGALVVESALCNASIPCSGTDTSVDGKGAVVVRVRFTPPSWITFGGGWVVSRAVQMKLRDN
jgi:hypothetical protein